MTTQQRDANPDSTPPPRVRRTLRGLITPYTDDELNERAQTIPCPPPAPSTPPPAPEESTRG